MDCGLVGAIFGRRHAVFLFKSAREMAVVGQTDLETDLFDLQKAVGVGKHFNGLIQPEVSEISARRCSRLFFEQPLKIRDRHVELCGHLSDRPRAAQVLGELFFDMEDPSVHWE